MYVFFIIEFSSKNWYPAVVKWALIDLKPLVPGKILNALKTHNIIIGTTDKKAKDFIYTVPVERAGEIFKK